MKITGLCVINKFLLLIAFGSKCFICLTYQAHKEEVNGYAGQAIFQYYSRLGGIWWKIKIIKKSNIYFL